MITSELALMFNKTLEHYRKQHKTRRKLAESDPAVQAAATLPRAALTEAAKEARKLGHDRAE